MSVFPGIIIGGPYYGGWGIDTTIAPLAVADQIVAPDAKVEAQDALDRQYLWQLRGQGQTPGFDNAPPESDWLWWQMRRYSTIQLAFGITVVPFLATPSTVEIVDDMGDPDLAAKWKANAEKDVLPRFGDSLPAQCECLFFGRWLQEIVWDLRGGRIVPAEFRSILPGMYIPYRNQYGQLAGFQTMAGEYRDARYALHAVNEHHLDPIFGYSRNAACREEWWRIRQSEGNGDRTERKASGIQLGIGVPTGASWTDDKGNPVIGKDMLQTILDAATANKGFVYPTIPFPMKAVMQNPELLKSSAINIQQFDWGNIGPALRAHLERIDKQEIKIMRAWRRPEREAMAGKHGTNAESETQGDIGTMDSEIVYADRCKEFTKQVLERYMVANAGPKYAGMLRIKPTPLSDPQQSFLQKAWLAMAASPTEGENTTIVVNKRMLGDRVELPLLSEEEEKAARVEAQAKANAQQKQQQAADVAKAAAGANGDGANGDGKPVNGQAKKLALAVSSLSRIGEFLED